MRRRFSVTAGSAARMGAWPEGDGVTFAVFSAHADRVEVCLYDGAAEIARVPLPERTGDVFHGHIPGIHEGQAYGLRAHGPNDPARGHRFNPARLLIDPYARHLTGPVPAAASAIGPGDPTDTGPLMPRAIVTEPLPHAAPVARIAPERRVIYEAHPKGLTAAHPGVPEALRGRLAGVASDALLDHLTRLGVTTVELLPIMAKADEPFLAAQGRTNFWGYNTAAFMAPQPTLASGIAEVREVVSRLHGAGLEVILDVVLNHTAEGDALGPTLSFRGLDNASYYRLQPDDPSRYLNDAGTGNTLNLAHPAVLRLALDTLRYWVTQAGVDGFRFDLAPILGREAAGFAPDGRFLSALRQDPVLSRVALIAEPWDLGPGGYALGRFPAPFAEWNDRFRDTTRRFWRGDGSVAPMAEVLVGSAPVFEASRRPPQASVNFISAHDGFTLADLTSFRRGLHDGVVPDHDVGGADGCGAEGPTADPAIIAARAQRRRNLLATLLLAQGTPMLLAGDEIGNGQGGEANAWNRDDPLGWVDWSAPDTALMTFVTRLIALRRSHPVLRQRRWLHARPRRRGGVADLFWRRADGAPMQQADWTSGTRILCVELRMAAATPLHEDHDDGAFLVLNPGDATTVALPPCPTGRDWVRVLDTAQPDAAVSAAGASSPVAAASVTLFLLDHLKGSPP